MVPALLWATATMDQQLFDAVAASDADAVYNNILTSNNPTGGVSVNVNAAVFGPKNDAPLHEAIRKNNPDIVKLLLLACAKVNTKNNLGMTSLHLVACCKKTCVRWISSACSSLLEQNWMKRTFTGERRCVVLCVQSQSRGFD